MLPFLITSIGHGRSRSTEPSERRNKPKLMIHKNINGADTCSDLKVEVSNVKMEMLPDRDSGSHLEMLCMDVTMKNIGSAPAYGNDGYLYLMFFSNVKSMDDVYQKFAVPMQSFLSSAYPPDHDSVNDWMNPPNLTLASTRQIMKQIYVNGQTHLQRMYHRSQPAGWWKTQGLPGPGCSYPPTSQDCTLPTAEKPWINNCWPEFHPRVQFTSTGPEINTGNDNCYANRIEAASIDTWSFPTTYMEPGVNSTVRQCLTPPFQFPLAVVVDPPVQVEHGFETECDESNNIVLIEDPYTCTDIKHKYKERGCCASPI